jgi:tripartite-type tricarboxylate transporter receptor subunit TctC
MLRPNASKPRWLAAAGLGLAASLIIGPAGAADYFAGKSIDLLIGAPPAGGYDIYGRALARHFGQHIPGHPSIVPKNMPGAGSARAAGFVATVAPKDGTVIAGIMPGAVIGPLLDPKADVLFDPAKVQYLGNVNNGTRVCISRKDSKIQTFADTLTQKAVFGGVSTNDSTRDYGYMHKKTSGSIYDLVTGYNGTADLSLALERKEIDGFCGFDWASLKSQKPDWVRDKQINILLQDGLGTNEELDRLGVPSVFMFIKNDTDRKVVQFIVSQQTFHRSFIAPPGIPAEPLNILRAAFDATMADPEFLADAKKVRIDVAPLSGLKVQEAVTNVYTAPKDIVELARRAINP